MNKYSSALFLSFNLMIVMSCLTMGKVVNLLQYVLEGLLQESSKCY